jgi:hypothetical protein
VSIQTLLLISSCSFSFIFLFINLHQPSTSFLILITLFSLSNMSYENFDGENGYQKSLHEFIALEEYILLSTLREPCTFEEAPLHPTQISISGVGGKLTVCPSFPSFSSVLLFLTCSCFCFCFCSGDDREIREGDSKDETGLLHGVWNGDSSSFL